MKIGGWTIIVILVILALIYSITGTLSPSDLKKGLEANCGLSKTCWFWSTADIPNCDQDKACLINSDCNGGAWCYNNKCMCPVY